MSTDVMQTSTDEFLEVVRDDGHWRWRYRQGKAGVELLSNKEYPNETSARRSASVAYPDVPFAGSPLTVDGDQRTKGKGRMPFIVAGLLCLVVVGLLILILRTK
jgi:hypothetical protein